MCHGSTGSGRSSASAYACSTSIPLSPSAASVPAAPPSCAGRRWEGASARGRCRRASSRPSARTSSAPPAAGACAPPSRSLGARRRAARTRRATPSSSSTTSRRRVARDERGRRVEDVLRSSRREWTCSDRSRNRRTSGSTGLPALRPSRASSVGVQAVGGEHVVRELRDEPDLRFGVRERAFRVEHRREPRVVRHRFAQRRRDEERLKRQRTPSAGRPASGCRSGTRRPRLLRPRT